MPEPFNPMMPSESPFLILREMFLRAQKSFSLIFCDDFLLKSALISDLPRFLPANEVFFKQYVFVTPSMQMDKSCSSFFTVFGLDQTYLLIFAYKLFFLRWDSITIVIKQRVND
mgnify:FL=1